MFTSIRSLNRLLSIAFVVILGACTGGGGCGGCSTAPLPGGALPNDQTIEGGAQIRVTDSGFEKLSQLLPAAITDSLAGGICINEQSVLGFVDVCYNDQGSCTNGCNVVLSTPQFTMNPTNGNTLNVDVQIHAAASVPVDYFIGTCTLTIAADLYADLDIGFVIDPTTGELRLQLNGINNFDLGNDSFNGCGAVSDLLQIVGDLLATVLDSFVGDLLVPVIDDFLQGVLPDPLGVEGLIDVQTIVGGVSPGTQGSLEAKLVPGGYVALSNGGMSLGIITGFNSDEDITTRTAALDSEPALCVPPFPAPNFAAPPHNLGLSSRGTFTLLAANEFNGLPEPTTDMAIGMSETTLDQIGHHLVASGGMCLGIGNLSDQLSVGTLALLVPSLGELVSGTGRDPLLLVTRPQRALNFSIGDGTANSASLTAHLEDFEVDFYGFLYERYTRLFTLSLTLNAGLNFEVNQPVDGPATLTPMLVGLTASEIQAIALNTEFLRETPAQLEAVLPTVFDIVLPQLTGAIGPIELPEFLGFQLRDLQIAKVSTSQDDFLALYTSLAAGNGMREAAVDSAAWRNLVTRLDGDAAQATARRAAGVLADGRARLLRVVTPAPADVRAALEGTGGALPQVEIAVDTHDSLGRALEWSWSLNDGIWRPYTTASPLVLQDRAFVWQGKTTVSLRARVIGTTSTRMTDIIDLPVIIDSVAPVIFADRTTRDGNGDLVVEAEDLVSSTEALQYAFGPADQDAPTTGWQTSNKLAAVTFAELTGELDALHLYVRDEAGNVSMMMMNGFHGQGSGQGCGCSSQGTPASGNLFLLALTGALVLLPRRRFARVAAWARVHGAKLALFVGVVGASSLMPACSCGGSEQACEVEADCASFCTEPGDVPFCVDGSCRCLDDIPVGKTGLYQDLTVSTSGTAWVSAYSQTHGDLVVALAPDTGRIPNSAWEWVDGVPDGPIDVPGATIRGGVSAPGPDVGMYTSIALQGDSPVVSYFDRDNGALKFASRAGGVWATHVVDGAVNTEGSASVGMYTSLTLRTDDGRPGIAYLAHIDNGGDVTAEVRFAAAQVPNPTSANDWVTFVVDTAPVIEDPANPNPFPLPDGLGLFVDAARVPNTQAPVVAYYDRAGGDLKLAVFNTASGGFDDPVIIDGLDVDAGWSPSLVPAQDGTLHLAYVSASYDNLMYINVETMDQEIIDDGYRLVGQTEDGLPKPEYHLVGDDVTLLLAGDRPTAIYQDATTHELMLSQRTQADQWTRVTIAGGGPDWMGGYGFFASAATGPTDLVMSTWVIDQPNFDNWVEVFRHGLIIE